MPTENRSSNTEMVSVLQREDRYIVIKRSDLERISAQHRFEFWKASRVVHERMFAAGAPARRFLVIESDWPEYEPTWAAIERRVTGSPAPQPHPEPIVWMVGTAIWWTKEEAERDAAATGLPIVGLGPMTCAAPAEKHRGEPVAWMDPRSPQMHATISNEVKQHNVKFGGAPASAINGYTVPLYTHADPGDLERCEARLHEVASLCATVEQERDTLRAQLAERDALLQRALPYLSNTPDLVQHGAEDLAQEIRSASAGKPCYGPNEWGTECGQCSKCESASAEPEAQS